MQSVCCTSWSQKFMRCCFRVATSCPFSEVFSSRCVDRGSVLDDARICKPRQFQKPIQQLHLWCRQGGPKHTGQHSKLSCEWRRPREYHSTICFGCSPITRADLVLTSSSGSSRELRKKVKESHSFIGLSADFSQLCFEIF